MRFVLDHDVPETPVRRLFTDRGHQCWRAPDHLAANGQDDEISVYADDKNAAVVTHDVDFTTRRKERTFGVHIRLKCHHAHAQEVLSLHIDELLEMLDSGLWGVFEVSRRGVKHFEPKPI